MSSRRRRHARSPASAPLDDDDLLCEILLRLPPQPSSLPGASLVCKRWRCLVSDPGFFRRFRLRHRRNPPLLGFFDRFDILSFLPTLEAPNRVPCERFSFQCPDFGSCSSSLGCRDGLMLLFLRERLQVLVWDPVTGDQHRIAIPAAFDDKKTLIGLINGAVLRAAEDARHFQVVLVVADGDDEQHIRALACVYSSKTGLWGNLISTPIPYQPSDSSFRVPTMVYTDDAVLAGGSLYWKLAGNMTGILAFDLEKQSLAVIRVPVDMYGEGKCFKVMRAEVGGLGFLVVSESDYTAKLWKRNTDCDGVASWELGRTIELDKLLPLKSEEKEPLAILGFAEQNNVMFLWTVIGVLMIQLESLEFKNLYKTMIFSYYHPFESVYSAGTCVSGGHDRAKLLVNT
ncbi:hypothetical protein CFC21_081990 [Triticum aestivum]|uniref:F-box domain-containing protein n=3 Tax=Triticum TaxID=4564 RepID=A0A9R1AW55_TRITD|nr:uncharacterized protein LOC123130171 [Triticum aestivum]KAF7077437.1 hypothetical protein CFC21_081990 [Triticum aestivum]VAI42429.1 unnamed protein product [Triticum turgidum subsp. durum]